MTLTERIYHFIKWPLAFIFLIAFAFGAVKLIEYNANLFEREQESIKLGRIQAQEPGRGFQLIFDPGTGCEYIVNYQTIIPRLDHNGKQICNLNNIQVGE